MEERKKITITQTRVNGATPRGTPTRTTNNNYTLQQSLERLGLATSERESRERKQGKKERRRVYICDDSDGEPIYGYDTEEEFDNGPELPNTLLCTKNSLGTPLGRGAPILGAFYINLIM
jgi:hypothetical protein